MAIKVHTHPTGRSSDLEYRLNQLAATNKILAVAELDGYWHIVVAESAYRTRQSAEDPEDTSNRGMGG